MAAYVVHREHAGDLVAQALAEAVEIQAGLRRHVLVEVVMPVPVVPADNGPRTRVHQPPMAARDRGLAGVQDALGVHLEA